MNKKQKYIVANWKMNGTKSMLEEWINRIFLKAKNNSFDEDSVEVILCPPAVLVDRAFLMAQTYNAQNDFYLSIGAQDVHQKENGAYTGDVGAGTIKEAGAKFVILGHSERREYHNESNRVVNQKVNTAINNGLIPVICIGEKELVRNSGEAKSFIEKQLLESIPENIDIRRIVIAYEPVWSIGTGKTPTIEEIEEMVDHIKYVVAKNRKISENNVAVLYGGSVKSDNSTEIMSLEEVDGVLVGGASLDPDDFFDIIKSSITQ
ncbi:triose-phosphate isomerase [Pseudomonadota bacterium]